tara:strand:+ start:139 stop:306 length:168 start_codon:yes stop_codon:yes gene_type:complete
MICIGLITVRLFNDFRKFIILEVVLLSQWRKAYATKHRVIKINSPLIERRWARDV